MNFFTLNIIHLFSLSFQPPDFQPATMALSKLTRLDFGAVPPLGPDGTTDGFSIGGAWPGVTGYINEFPGWGPGDPSGIFQDPESDESDYDPFTDLPQFLNPPTEDKFNATYLAAPPTVTDEPSWQQIINPCETEDEFIQRLGATLQLMGVSYGVVSINGRMVTGINGIIDGYPIEVHLRLYSPTEPDSKFILGYVCISGDPADSSTFFDELSHYITNGADATRPYVRPGCGFGLPAQLPEKSDVPHTANNQKPTPTTWLTMLTSLYHCDQFPAALALFHRCSSAGLLKYFKQLAAVVLGDDESTEGGAAKRPRDDMQLSPAAQLCIIAALVNAAEDAVKKGLMPKYGAKSTEPQFSSEIALAVYRGLPALFRKMLEIVQDFKSDVEGARWMIKCLGTLVGIMELLGLPMVGGMYAKLIAMLEGVHGECEFLRKTIEAVMEA